MILADSSATHQRAAEIIARGGVIAFRTDTFYGVGANPFDRAAVHKIKELKGRDDDKPILIVVSDQDQVSRFIGERSTTFDQLARVFWPGPLTLIGRANPNVPHEITAGTKTVGLRLPNDDRVRALARACGGALTATSANPSNHAPAVSAQEVQSYFRDGIDLIVDEGQATTTRPSTVVDVTTQTPRLIREGVIKWSVIESELKRGAH